MASTKIQDVASVSSLDGTEKVPISNGSGSAVTATISLIRDGLITSELIKDYYTKTEISSLLNNILTKKVVDSIADVTLESIVYLVKNGTTENGNLYDEYMLINGAVEKIGQEEDTSITNSEIDNLFSEIFT